MYLICYTDADGRLVVLQRYNEAADVTRHINSAREYESMVGGGTRPYRAADLLCLTAITFPEKR
jgi:hypothetical protein